MKNFIGWIENCISYIYSSNLLTLGEWMFSVFRHPGARKTVTVFLSKTRKILRNTITIKHPLRKIHLKPRKRHMLADLVQKQLQFRTDYTRMLPVSSHRVSIVTCLRSSQKQPPEVFYKKGVIKNIAKLTGKHLCRSLFIKRENLAQVFSCEICDI